MLNFKCKALRLGDWTWVWLSFWLLRSAHNLRYVNICMEEMLWRIVFCVEDNMTWWKLSKTIVSFSIFLFYCLLQLNDECDRYLWHEFVNDGMSPCFEWCYYARSVFTSMFYLQFWCNNAICWIMILIWIYVETHQNTQINIETNMQWK